MIVSVKDQKLGLYQAGHLKTSYKISTSKFGIGDRPGSNYTPLGKHEVVAKIGHGLPAGAVLKSRQWNGEVVRPNAPGRDPIVSRILWLSGMESSNRNAYNRFIYIHGTTEEFRLGTPASYGCVRMAAKDVIRVFDSVPIGAKVVITREGLPSMEAGAVPLPVDKPVPIPALTADSKPAHEAGAPGPVPVMVTRGAKKEAPATSPATAASSAPIPVTEAEVPKKRLFGFMGKKSEASAPAVAAAPAPAPAAAARPAPATATPGAQTKGKPQRQPAKREAATVAAAESQPVPTRRRMFGLLGSKNEQPAAPAVPAPAPVSAAASPSAAPKKNASAVAGPPARTTKPKAATTTKKSPAKKKANGAAGA